MFGMRPDGRRVKGIDPVMQITPYVMPMRCDAQVFLKHSVDMDVISHFIRREKAQRGETLSHMHVIASAYVRSVSENPTVNRFIVNKQLFARNNCSIAITVLKDPANADEGESVVKVSFDLTDTVYDVRDRMDSGIAAGRGYAAEPTFADKLLSGLFKVPGVVTVAAGLIKLLDRYGIAPRALIDGLPFYVGLYITNTASIGLHDVNHHLYNFGNVSLFFGLGMPERIAVVENGETRMKRFLPVGITADERVCSGAHYARFFASMRRYLENPQLLTVPPEKVCYDGKMEYHVPKVPKAD